MTETNVQQQNQQQQVRPSSGSNTNASGSTASTLNTAVWRIFHIGPPSVSTVAEGSVCVVVQEVGEDIATETRRRAVILDSGSDVSLLPLSYANDSLGESSVKLQDCLGSSLKTTGQQDATLVVYDALSGEEIELHHMFLIGNVHNCILSSGELYKSGCWKVKERSSSWYLLINKLGYQPFSNAIHLLL